MHFSTLNEWITWISSIHLSEIELGLERVKIVAARLNILSPTCPIIIIGGTNGKGSCVAGLEAIYREAGFKVGAFTTPFLFKYNEQVRINGKTATDDEFCQAFAKIDAARNEISLTPFEFSTLAALLIFQVHALDVWLLEVGLGGRLDAVNIMDADVAVITSISIDHVEWLGSTREKIAYEKAGIFRKNKPVVCGDSEPPHSLEKAASLLNAPFFCQNRNFFYHEDKRSWVWSYQDIHYQRLPINTLATQNMSIVLMVITLLQQRLPVSEKAIYQGLLQVKLFGRVQVLAGPITEIYDVAHNPASVAELARRLKQMSISGKVHAVFSMLADKDIAESLKNIRELIDDWYVAPLNTKRAMPDASLRQTFLTANIANVEFFSTIETAFDQALVGAQINDVIVVFGSFHTVAEVFKHRHADKI